MSSTAYWIIGTIVIFVLGQWLMLRPNPREQALGQLRDRARKLGLNPRLVKAPAWIWPTVASATPRPALVACYSVLLPNATLPLRQMRIENGHWQPISTTKATTKATTNPDTSASISDTRWGPVPPLAGAYAVEMQANSISIYWDEEADLAGAELDKLPEALKLLALPQH